MKLLLLDTGAEEATLSLEDFRDQGKIVGDFEIIVRKKI